MNRLAAVVALLLSAPLAAQAPVERDSAGIRIIENPARATAPVVFQLGARTVELGGPQDRPEDEFGRGMTHGFRLSDNSIVVPDKTRLHYFDAQGKRLGTFGRDGAGPQEFRSINSLEFCRIRGDTIVVNDYRNGRIATIHQRSVLSTIPLTAVYGGGFAGCFDDGSLLIQGGLPNFKTPTYTLRLNRLRHDGTLINTLGEHVVASPHVLNGLRHPQVVTWGQRMYIGDGSTSEVRVYNTAGKLTHIVRTADPLQRITKDDEERLTKGQSPNMLALGSSWRPETFPSYSEFRVDANGRLWVRDHVMQRVKTGIDGWTAFDVNGRLIGRFELPKTLPPRSSVLAFGSEEVQISSIDDDGFAHIGFYPLRRK